ncbi:hypothetical protein SAMN06264364_12748 [Quadrisphaera granulorum]|uniref:Uncharacterized protein n=1 Tax=Quadrisphaera granulorum TaxID=317664 RepID=A0A316AGS8_9ACTN|nr:hypothetical protein [Quadrisphaera granulorum]PWJ49057.1 hypothetical protein BXY45_12748 [Quadrisphaera granulorum]SZE98267.1 hypothetical protein SAMN06264364_12748 [Quadrisphaera granulorum]
MSTPSFIDRLRSRSRRSDRSALLGAAPDLVLETSPGPLPEDHWHAGDPRLAPGDTVLRTADVPSPRRPVDQHPVDRHPVDRHDLAVVPEVDLRADVVDLRGAAAPVAPTAPAPATEAELPEPSADPSKPDRPVQLGCDEPSTWWG